MSYRKLFLIRHAQSLTNADHQLKIAKDFSVPLTELGETQALALGKKLFSEHIDANPNVHSYVFTSPYRRAQQTAKGLIEGVFSCKHSPRDYELGDRPPEESSVYLHGPTIIPDLMEREIQEHPLIISELKHIDALPGDERFFYRSQYIESACNAASRMQRALYDIRSWSRSPRHQKKDMNIFVVSHSLAIEAWEYLEEYNNHNDKNCHKEGRFYTNSEAKKFPLNMADFGEKRRLKNSEYRLFEYQA